MDDALYLVIIVHHGEIGEAGFVEFIKYEWAEDFFGVYEDHFGFRHHDGFDRAVIETHDSGDTTTVAAA